MVTVRISKEKCKIALLLVVLRLLFDMVYCGIISPFYAYAGFINDWSWDSVALSILIFVVSLPFIVPIIADSRDRVSAFVAEVLYVLSYIPFTTCVLFGMFPEGGFIGLNVLYWLVFLAAVELILSLPLSPKRLLVHCGRFTLNDKFISFLAVISLAVVLFISGRYTGFRLNFTLMNVYDLRTEAQGFNMPTIFTYLLAWTGAINPLMVGYCADRKRWLAALVFLSVQVLSFGIAGHKSVLMAPFLVVAVVVACKNVDFCKIKRFFLYAMGSLNILAMLEYIVFSTFWLAAVFVRRICFIPNHIHYSYYDFFSNNQFDWFRGSFLRHFGFVSPYGDISSMIGDLYYNIGNHANNGLFSDAFSNMGYVGIILMPILLATVLHFADRCTAGIASALVAAVGTLWALSLMSTNMFTVLMTHGMLIACLVFILLKRDRGK